MNVATFIVQQGSGLVDGENGLTMVGCRVVKLASSSVVIITDVLT